MRGTWVVLIAVLAVAVFVVHRAWTAMAEGRAHQAMLVGPLVDPAARAVRPLSLDPDGYTWHNVVDAAREAGVVRLRVAPFDNAPEGRAVHWSSAVAWLIRAVDGAEEPGGGSGYRRSWVIGPMLQVVLLVALAVLLVREAGPVVASTAVVLVALNQPLYWAFHPLRVDHQGLQVMAAVGMIVSLVVAGFGMSPRPTALAFVVSAVCGAAGLWLGATVMVVVLAVAGVAAAVAIVVATPRGDGDAGGPWRVWGSVGAVGGLFFYVVEYAPWFPLERMEVNHPTYAVAWLGAGYVLGELQRSRAAGLAAVRKGWVVAGVAAVALPAVWVVAGFGVHAFQDPVVQRMHAFILEFRGLAVAQPDTWPSVVAETLGGLAMVAVVAWVVACRSGVDPGVRARCVGGGVVVAALLALPFWQERWVPFAAGGGAVVVPVLLAGGGLPEADRVVRWLRRGAWVAVVVTGFAWGAAVVRPRSGATLAGGALDPALTKAALVHRLCLELRAVVPEGRPIVVCDPTLAPAVTYFTGVPTVASLYWENAGGMEAAAAFLGGVDEAGARRLVAARGWTHVLIAEDQEVDASLAYVAQGSREPDVVRKTLAHRMMRRPHELPSWIEFDPVGTLRLRAGVRAAGAAMTNRFTLYRLRP